MSRRRSGGPGWGNASAWQGGRTSTQSGYSGGPGWGNASAWQGGQAQAQSATPAQSGVQLGQFNPYADAGFVLGNAGINQANADAQANFDYGSLRGNQTYGYDANGNLISTGAGYNPYSQAAQLQRSYDNSKRGTLNSYAANGQLYAGSLKNAQNTNDYNFNRSSDSLQRSASDFYHGLQSSLQATKTAGQQQYANLVMQALQNYLSSQQG